MANRNFNVLDTRDNAELFQPLIEHLKKTEWEEDIKETLDQYMWMGRDDKKTYYKHIGNRSYFNVFHDGKTEGELVDWQQWNYSKQI